MYGRVGLESRMVSGLFVEGWVMGFAELLPLSESDINRMISYVVEDFYVLVSEFPL